MTFLFLAEVVQYQTSVVDTTLISKILETMSPYAMLVLFIVGLFKKWWVLGWTYQDLKDELDRIQAQNEDAINTIGEAVNLAKSTVPRVRRRGVNRRGTVK